MPAAIADIAPGQRIDGLQRGDAVIVIPLYGAHDLFARCLTSVVAHAPAGTTILVADDHGPDPASRALAEELAGAGRIDGRLLWLRQPENLGFVGNCNTAFAVTAPADVLLLNSDVEVAAGFFEGMREAAYSDGPIASASALANHASILSVPFRNQPRPLLPADASLTAAAAALRERSPRLRPRIPTGIGHCLYLRRSALDLIGGFDTAFAPAYGEEVDWSQKAALRGFVHVAADDVLVQHSGSGSLSVDGDANPIQAEHEALINNRYPYYRDAVVETEEAMHGPLPRALGLARRELRGMSVTVDGRALGPVLMGTQLAVLELISALSGIEGLSVRVVVPEDVGDYAATVLRALPHVATTLAIDAMDEALEHPEKRTDIVHRPYQVTNADDLKFLRSIGQRLVITHHDLISFRNPGYHGSASDWLDYRRVTRQALAAADAVVFDSAHAASDARADDLVEPDRALVAPIGVDHRLAEPDADRPATPPAGAAELADRRYLLCLGTDYRHKNRLFAIQLLEALRERGWDGDLVLAGPRVQHGSSAGDEAAFLATRQDLAAHVTTLPALREPEKRWLYEHATAAAYPTLYEGFGFVPFEAAEFGIPCLFAPVTSLAETLAGVEAPIVPWDLDISAERCLALLTDSAAAAAQVAAIQRAAQPLTWAAHAQRLAELYEQVLVTPGREAAWLAHDLMISDAERGRFEGLYWHLHNQVGPLGLGLVGPQGKLPEQSQRALAALAGRPATARPLNAALRLIHRIGAR